MAVVGGVSGWVGDSGHVAEGKAAFGVGGGEVVDRDWREFCAIVFFFFVILCHSNKTILVICTSNFLSKSSL